MSRTVKIVAGKRMRALTRKGQLPPRARIAGTAKKCSEVDPKKTQIRNFNQKAGGFDMHKVLATCLHVAGVGVAAALAAGGASANDDLIKLSQNPQGWVMPAGNYNNQRYS